MTCFIAGDYEEAEVLFQQVLDDPDSDEDLLTAHLYLGRIYLEREEYKKAAEMFSAGKALGGDARFAAYFEEAASHLRVSRRTIIQENEISRGQLAALLQDMFEGAFDAGGNTSERAQTAEKHWSTGYTEFAEEVGVMNRLPDGDFHPDAKVTGPAFFVIVSRLAEKLGLSESIVEEAFPGGMRGAVAALDAESKEGLVSGREAVSVLTAVARAAGL